MFICGDSFIFLNSGNKNIVKYTYKLHVLSKKKKFKFILCVFLKFKEIKKKISSLYIFTFFLCKTYNILMFSIKNQKKKIHTYNFNFNFLKTTIHKYSILFGFKFYNNLLIGKNYIVVNTNKLLITPKLTCSSIYKNISILDSYNTEFQFIRKNKVYNKGRYSRCRQNYRTGVYLCMYLSIVSIFGLYYWFFKFSFNFSYLWWFFIGFLISFLFPKIIKYRLYEPITTIKLFCSFFN